MLQNQKVSENGLTRRINELRRQTGNQVSWEAAQKVLSETFGFWQTVKLCDKQEDRLKEVYEKSFKNQNVSMEKSEYSQDEPIAAEAKRIMDEIAMVGWTSGGHSAGYVPVFAVGAGSGLFSGRLDNTQIPVKIAQAAGYVH